MLKRARFQGGVSLGAVLLAGCVSAPPREPVPVREAPAFSETGNQSRSDRWWESFDDPALSAVIERGLESNFTLRAVYERLRAARAVVRLEESDRWPELDGVGGATLRDGSDVDERTQLSLGLEASYEVDLWGRIRAAIDAQEFEALATAQDYQAAAISLSAEIALTAYRLAEASAQLALIDSQLQTNRDVLTVIENRFAIGQSGSADVLRQRQLVEATREQRLVESATREVLSHRLAVLTGSPAQSAGEPPARELPTLGDLPAIGLPAELVQRRPDVRAAYFRLESADRSLAAAVRDQYPRIDLAASLVTTAENPSGLFSNWLASLAGQVIGPIIDGGQRRAEIEQSEAVRGQRLAEYGDAVLVAFQEVEDALAQERYQTQRIESLEEQLALARSTYTQLRNQYLNGAGDFIDVLVALRDQQSIERDLIEAALLRVEYRIALHRAIAGPLPGVTADGQPETKGTP